MYISGYINEKVFDIFVRNNSTSNILKLIFIQLMIK